MEFGFMEYENVDNDGPFSGTTSGKHGVQNDAQAISCYSGLVKNPFKCHMEQEPVYHFSRESDFPFGSCINDSAGCIL